MNNGVNIRVEERFATGNGHNRCPTLFGCPDTFINAEMLFQDILRLVDFTTPLTMEITAKEWFKH
jgi:hypothetical protein